MHKNLILPLFLAGAACCATQAQADLTVVSHGGANKDAQVAAFYNTYQAQTGTKVVAGEFNGEMAKIKVMVDTGSVSWDVVEMEMPELARACDEGLLEEFSPDPAIAKNLLPETAQQCGVGFFVWSTVLAYNADKLQTAPSGWQDFWDLNKFPGKRGLRKGAMYTLEFALLADGVPASEVYTQLATKEGQDRAFHKLDEIKPSIQWWEAGAQPPQYLASGDVVMSSAYSGRISAVQNDSHLRIVWNGGIYDMDAWAIPRGSKNSAEALKFINHTLAAEQQKSYAENIAYGPVNRQAIGLLSAKRLEELPTGATNLQQQLHMSAGFWADHGEQLEQRFNAWAAK
ncbi:ABC transporter substrate-binding protein [Pseudomonas akapageensis]|uniref:ABC transporter substrate-binding protein n=1 Tax=Pseudomonas akapageensis TaxID=2609961 RepID=UPI0014096772|nr:ABC transporter substrate-binding protein [Pseudomonas akapageensis]